MLDSADIGNYDVFGGQKLTGKGHTTFDDTYNLRRIGVSRCLVHPDTERPNQQHAKQTTPHDFLRHRLLLSDSCIHSLICAERLFFFRFEGTVAEPNTS